jgi:membrane-bound lytic murein transglycosylase C
MIKKLLFLSILVCPFLVLQADSFEDFKRSQRGEFKQYKKTVAEEFVAYKKIYQEELDKYKKGIAKHWDKPKISTKKTWVEYSKDKKTRRVVNYEKNYIEISVKADQSETLINKKIKQELHDLLLENKKTAFKRDDLASNVERRIKKVAERVKTAKVKKQSILKPVFFKQKNPSTKQVKKKVEQLVKASQRTISQEKGQKTVNIKIQLPQKGLQRKAGKLKPFVAKYAKKEKVDLSLVYAVIQTESAFNPMARSHVPAYGLMQIVPASAGKDATQYLNGKMELLAPSYLYDSEKNIQIGAAYLHILYYRYLRKIKDPKSRLYCTIAAYNTGAGNVARAFIGNTNINKASATINKKSPEQVYQHLLKKLPHKETQDYLKRVTKRMKNYS